MLKANPDYTSPPANAEHTGPAYVDEVIWKFVADPTTRVAALKSGEVDAVYDVPAVQWESTGDAGFELHKYITPGRPQQLTFNTAEGPFTDERVRQAFAYSIDREAIVETIGHGVIPYEGNGGVSQTTPGWSEKAANWYSLDLDKAADLLDEAGWTDTDDDGYRVKDGETLDIVLPYGAGSIINADGASILQGVQEQAKQAGFKVELIPVPQAELFAGGYSQPDERDIYPGYWTAVTSGILYINWRQSTEECAELLATPRSRTTPSSRRSSSRPTPPPTSTRRTRSTRRRRSTSPSTHSPSACTTGSRRSPSSPKLQGVWQEHAQGGPTFYDAHFVE